MRGNMAFQGSWCAWSRNKVIGCSLVWGSPVTSGTERRRRVRSVRKTSPSRHEKNRQPQDRVQYERGARFAFLNFHENRRNGIHAAVLVTTRIKIPPVATA